MQVWVILDVSWIGIPFLLATSQCRFCFSAFLNTEISRSIAVVSFWPLNSFDITSFLNNSLLEFYEWFDVVRVPAQREPIFLMFDHNFVSYVIDVDDFEGLS